MILTVQVHEKSFDGVKFLQNLEIRSTFEYKLTQVIQLNIDFFNNQQLFFAGKTASASGLR